MKILSEVYRCSKREGLYLYVLKGADLKELPDALIKSIGVPELSMTILLTPEKNLARANIVEVLEALNDKGYYLQMPPIVGAR